jgi:hypothetical protein
MRLCIMLSRSAFILGIFVSFFQWFQAFLVYVVIIISLDLFWSRPDPFSGFFLRADPDPDMQIDD